MDFLHRKSLEIVRYDRSNVVKATIRTKSAGRRHSGVKSSN
jgi:hypothetical protein